MTFMSFYIDCTERTCRTEVFARAASDATFNVHHRNLRRIRLLRIRGHHRDGSRRAMAGTVAAIYPIGERHTVLFYPHGMTNLNSRLICRSDFQYRTCRTDLRTFGAFRPAIAPFIRGLGLHQRRQFRRGPKHPVRTYRDTKLTARTMCSHIAQTLRSGWYDRGCPVRDFLVQDHG